MENSAKPEIFVSRTLNYKGSFIEILISKPEKDGEDFRCVYHIKWPSSEERGYCIGIDEVQSLFLCMKKIGSIVYSSEEAKSGNLIWLEKGDGYGFPLPKSIRHLCVGSDQDI